MDSALNRAHQLERKANLLFRSRKFDEAIECHQHCAELLNEAMQLTSVSQALESMQLQHKYHISRKKVIRYKQNLLEKIKAVNRQMAKLAMNEAAKQLAEDEDEATTKAVDSRRRVNEIQTAIYRNIEETDSLLRGLICGDFETPSTKDMMCINMLPQDDKIIIEELRINNRELRSFVDQLSTQLEQSREENQKLKLENQFLRRQMEHYELERSKPHTATDSSSPFIYSPSGDLSPEIFNNIPHLPPLEMPNFDFHRFSSSTDDNTADYETTHDECPQLQKTDSTHY